MVCGHCHIAFHHNTELRHFTSDDHFKWFVDFAKCSECGNANIGFYKAEVIELLARGGGIEYGHQNPFLVLTYPLFNSRPPCPLEVPEYLAKDYLQACNVLTISPEASAALSRRCVQGILREKGYAQRELAMQIQAVLDSKTLPTHISSVLDAVRNIGNFAAHPMKSQHSGEILEVEPGEAEWNLEVLEALFDFYFVQEVANQKRIDALNARLAEAGKPPIKGI